MKMFCFARATADMNKLLLGGYARGMISRGKSILRCAERGKNAYRKPIVMTRPFHSTSSLLSMYFTEDHEWISVDGDVGTVGITRFASDQLGDLTYCELPEIGTEFGRGDAMAVIESVKAASDLYAPVSGTVVEVNQGAVDSPEIITTSPMETGWLVKMTLSAPEELGDLLLEDDYKKITPEE